ncbi:MAG: hypothetical protein ACLQIB_23135 [Isosphaeraceae bacterium]
MVGSLLSSPPARGALKAAIRCLAAKTRCHPTSGCDVQFSAVTIERWCYTARRERDDPVGVLRRAVRKDCGKVSLAAALAQQLFLQYREYPHWSDQRANCFVMRFGWNPSGLSVKAMERSRSRACATRFRVGIVTSAK